MLLKVVWAGILGGKMPLQATQVWYRSWHRSFAPISPIIELVEFDPYQIILCESMLP